MLNKSSLLSQWWFTCLLLISILALNALPPDIEAMLDLRHHPVSNGEWWRIYSSQISHLSFNHTLLNFAGYAFIAFSFREEISAKREIFITFISMSGVGLGIYIFNPDMYSYVGLSGAIYGVLIAFVIIGINRTPGLSILFLGFIVAKFIFEHFNGGAASETEQFIGGKVATDSHLYGALTGILPGLYFFQKDRQRLSLDQTERFITQFKHPYVKDLAWALHSAPLLSVNTDEVSSFTNKECKVLAIEFLPTLIELDKNPSSLIEYLEPENHRLGIYFEKLLAFWIEHNDRYSLIAKGLKVEKDKRTLGEFDFIVFDNELKKTLHWEVAMKFYLGIPPIQGLESFYGPNKHDRLDIKTKHLTEKQIQLSSNPDASKVLSEKGIQVDSKALIVKGRLFYPDKISMSKTANWSSLAPSHLKHHWLTLDDFEQISLIPTLGKKFHIAERNEWMADKESKGFDYRTLKHVVRNSLKDKPIMIIERTFNRETKRFFITPNEWCSFT
ncbi:MAG: rhombosortase [Pseudomonadales bacterium]|nr:rhombosortase [Pseudomonadales bacterium]